MKAKGSRFRSAWLYEAAVAADAIHRLLDALGGDDAVMVQRLAPEADYDLQAVFVCLLTAGFAAAGRLPWSATPGEAGSACHRPRCGRLGPWTRPSSPPADADIRMSE